MKRVFVLGAGFSKAAGMPLATELLAALLDEAPKRTEATAWLASLRERCEVLGAGARINIEEFFDFAKHDADLFRVKQQLVSPGQTLGETPGQWAAWVKRWMRQMEQGLGKVLWRAQERASKSPVEAFASCLGFCDVVLTFNYDTLLESVLASQNKAWNHGFAAEQGVGVKVLKMHGSIDWIMADPSPGALRPPAWCLLIEGADGGAEADAQQTIGREGAGSRWALYRCHDPQALGNLLARQPLVQLRWRSGMAGLGSYKPLQDLIGSATTWCDAFEALKRADEVWVVGFSLSPFDSFGRFHLAGCMSEREHPLAQLVLVDPNADALAGRFRPVFNPGKLVTYKCAAEDMAWATELGSEQ